MTGPTPPHDPEGSSDSRPRRYVVLHHFGIDHPHFDLMFESLDDDSLVTFRVDHWPPEVDETFTPLPNHRRAYLTYEGPVSNNRGEVRRVAGGVCHATATPAGWNFTTENLALRLPRLRT